MAPGDFDLAAETGDTKSAALARLGDFGDLGTLTRSADFGGERDRAPGERAVEARPRAPVVTGLPRGCDRAVAAGRRCGGDRPSVLSAPRRTSEPRRAAGRAAGVRCGVRGFPFAMSSDAAAAAAPRAFASSRDAAAAAARLRFASACCADGP